MSIPYVVDGETDLDSALFNPIIRGANRSESRVYDLRRYDPDPTGQTSSSAAFTDMFDDIQGALGNGLGGAYTELPEGELVVDETIELTRFTGRFGGMGRGQSPAYSALPGHGTVIRWDGAAGDPIIRVRDSRDVILEQFRIEGKDGTLASYGIEFYNESGDTNGSNEYLVVRDVHIGRYPWTAQGTDKGDVSSGIGFTGDNANNDQFRLSNVSVGHPTEYGLYIQNSQSVGGTAHSLAVIGAGIAGVSTAASIHLYDPEFYSCATDIIATEYVYVGVENIKSEGSFRMAQLPTTGTFDFRGGNVQVQEIVAGGEVLIDASPSDGLFVLLDGLDFTGMTDATKARFEIGPVSPYVGNFQIDVNRCRSIVPAQLVFASGASMWAGSPESKGVVEWRSTMGTSRYQFRNELRQFTSGGRTTLDYSAWDAPFTD